MKIRRKLWPFWATRDRQNKWKKGAQAIGNPPKSGEKIRFWVIFGCFLGSGARLGAVAFRVQKKVPKMVWIWSGFWLVFGPFWHFLVSC